LIFNLNLFSGNVLLNLNGWNPESEEKISLAKTKPYSYIVENDKTIL